MQPHVLVYTKFFGIGEQDYHLCEYPGCMERAADVHHIDRRGAGGDPTRSKDTIENLAGVCRQHHTLCEHNREENEKLRTRHLQLVDDRRSELKELYL